MGAFDWYDNAQITEVDERDYFVDIALEVVRLAFERTPVKSGRLADSYFIEVYGDLPHQIRVVNDCEYALYVHEKMENNHPNGGQAKFLEDAGFDIESVYDVKCYIKLDVDEIALYFNEPVGTPVTGDEDDEYLQNKKFNEYLTDVEEPDDNDDIIETFNSYLNYDSSSGKLNLYDDKFDFTPINFDSDSHRFKDTNIAGQGTYRVNTKKS